nr:hypothetical protein GCM10020093_079250 [Planobispora longispora]
MKAPYAVTGYWLIPTADHCTWRGQFRAIHQVGGDTVIRIGWGLQARQVDEEGKVLDKEGAVDNRYAPCEEDGVPCVAAAERDLAALNPGNRISWTFVYRTDEAFGPGVFRCPEVEKKIEVDDDTVFYRIIAPEDGSDDATCENLRSRGRAYHVILIAAAKEDSLTELLDLGDQFGMKVFPALPLAPRDPGQATRASERGVETLTTLTRRILQDYGNRFQGRASLGGFYQPFELQMRDMAYSGSDDPEVAAKDNPTLKVYASQHEIVQQVMPDKPILVSPYLEARKDKAFSATPGRWPPGSRRWPGPASASSRRRTAGAPARSGCSGRTSATNRWTSGSGRWSGRAWTTATPITARPATTTGRWPRPGPGWSSRATTCSCGPTSRRSSPPGPSPAAPAPGPGAHGQGTARPGRHPGRPLRLQGRLLHVERLLHLRRPGNPVAGRGDRPRPRPAHPGGRRTAPA